MQIRAFKMKLNPGFKDEYRSRHNNIWPELEALLKNNGITDYDIFYDEDTDILFCLQKIDSDNLSPGLSDNELMKKWWEYMADIMDVNSDNSPVVKYLEPVFHLK